MRKYELVVVFRPGLEAEKEKLLKGLQDLLSKEDVSITSSSWWGKKTLSYEIKKEKEGLYILLELETTSNSIGDSFNKDMKNDDSILRYLLVKKEEDSKKTKKKKLTKK